MKKNNQAQILVHVLGQLLITVCLTISPFSMEPQSVKNHKIFISYHEISKIPTEALKKLSLCPEKLTIGTPLDSDSNEVHLSFHDFLKVGLVSQPHLVSLTFQGDFEVEDLFGFAIRDLNLSVPFEGHLSFLNTIEKFKVTGKLTGCCKNDGYFWCRIVPAMPELESIIIGKTDNSVKPSGLKDCPKLGTISIKMPMLREEDFFILKKERAFWVLASGVEGNYIKGELQKLNDKYELSSLGEAAYGSILKSPDHIVDWGFFDRGNSDDKREATKVARNIDLMFSEKIAILDKAKSAFSQDNITEKGTYEMLHGESLNYISIQERMRNEFSDYFSNNG